MNKIIFFVICAFFSLPLWAYNTTLDTGRLLQDGHYKMGVESQFVTSGDDGINIAGRFDGPINDELGWKAHAGFGTTDGFVGGYVKWIPYPDLEKQPAVGLIGGVQYARYSGLDELSLRIHPLVSKQFNVDLGEVTPYASLPLGLRSLDGETDLVMQLALGSEFRPMAWENIRVLAELAFDVRKSFSYFLVGATLEFDEENGIEFK